MAFNPEDINPVKGATYYVNEEPTPEEIALFPLPVNFKIVTGDKFKLVSYKANGTRLVQEDTDKYYVHEQTLPSAIWIIEHPLNKNPSVTITDSAKTVVMAPHQYITDNKIKIVFKSAFAGKAYLN